jgi:hypothetical protein
VDPPCVGLALPNGVRIGFLSCLVRPLGSKESPMKHSAICCLVLEVALASSTTVAAQVLTSQYDNLRTGATLGEKILTPQT